MISDFPRAYRVVRQGQWQTASVANLAELFALRMELEIIRRFGAGATAELVSVIDARLARIWTTEQADISARAAWIPELQEMKGILCDAMASANAQAVAEMDRCFPELTARLPMKSIQKDAEQFREDVIDQAKASDADVDAMLAAFEQATFQADGPTASAINGPVGDDMVDALLNEAALAAGPAEVAEASDLPETSSVGDPIEAAMAELIDASPVEAEAAPCLETVSEQVAETLASAEQQIDAIASAFETAAAELGQMTADVQQVSQTATAAPQESPTIQAQQDDTAFEPAFDVTSAASVDSGGPCGCPATGSPTAGVKTQIQQARTKILSELDDVLALLERVDQMQAQADASMQRAKSFEHAAARAHEAGQYLAEAEAEAATARAMFEQAQVRVGSARQSWEQARQEAASAAAAT